MKLIKKKFALTGGALLLALTLVGCGNTDNSSSSSSSGGGASDKPISSSSSKSQQTSRKYNVTIDGKTTEVAEGSKLTKPSNPTAPAGKTFFGWKNTLNGGQIWDFDHEDLNVVMSDINLEPCFVETGLKPQLFQAELCPNINAVYGGELGMPGATYSGGQQGKGLIGRDYDSTTGATGIDNDNIAYVHFMYVKGDKLTWEVESETAVENVTLFARFSAEYGIIDSITGDRYSKINDTSFPITVNNTPIKYGNITFHNIPEIGQILTFQDFYIGSISLNAGKNVIEMTVDNMDTLNGTIASSAPCVDAIKLYSDSTITWDKAEYDNLVRD